jgi:hypothetical protein
LFVTTVIPRVGARHFAIASVERWIVRFTPVTPA